MQTADPKNMAAYLKELGPDKIAAALCAAFEALSPLCRGAGETKEPADDSEPAATSMADLGAKAAQAYGDRSKGGASW